MIDVDEEVDVSYVIAEEQLSSKESEEVLSQKNSTHTLINKVQCDVSPYFFSFYNYHPCHVVIDTGDTSSVISISLKAAKVPTSHSACTADKSPLVEK